LSIKICFAGKIATGKSSIAQAVAQHTGFSIVSFGDILGRDMEKRGLLRNRKTLQIYGQSIIKQQGYRGFFQWIIEHSQHIDWNMPLIVDGFRHRLVYESVSDKFSTILIYCDCDTVTQVERIMHRDRITFREAESIISHETEKYVSELEHCAHIICRQNFDIPAIVAEIDTLICNF
jgi:dephospho-CoA kinase